MKNLIFGAVLSFLLYLALKSGVVFTELNTLFNPEYYPILGISLAFSWSVLLYLGSKLKFAIGVNISLLAIAFPPFVNSLVLVNGWLQWVYLFFFIFPIIFLVKYLFFTDMEDKFDTRIVSLITFCVIGVLSAYLAMLF